MTKRPEHNRAMGERIMGGGVVPYESYEKALNIVIDALLPAGLAELGRLERQLRILNLKADLEVKTYGFVDDDTLKAAELLLANGGKRRNRE